VTIHAISPISIVTTGHEEDEGDLMEVPLWYLEENKDQLKR
jgi:hypothetical protein